MFEALRLQIGKVNGVGGGLRMPIRQRPGFRQIARLKITSRYCAKDTGYSRVACIKFRRGLCVWGSHVASFVQVFTLAFSCSVISSGCSIHQLPKDVTGIETPTLVRKIRCEARSAIFATAVEILRKGGHHQDVTELDDLETLRSTPAVTRWEVERINTLARIGIVYDFSLEGVETDGATFNADIVKPLKG